MTIVLLVTCLIGTKWAGTVPTGFLHELSVTPGQYLVSDYYVQNNQKKPSDNTSFDDALKPRKDSGKSKTLTPEKDGPEKTKPVKPFVPSEKIPVDQGVDFPYDI